MKINLTKVQNEIAKRHLLDFTKATMPTFFEGKFHNNYYEVLDLFAKGKIKRLIISVPPQHGKSEGSTRRLPAYLLGLNPDLKVAVASYSTPFARKFNRDVQRIIDSKEYNSIFPDTILNNSNVVSVSSSFLRNADEFEVVGHRGGLKAVGRGGALTGNPVDIMIMDDLYKDYQEGNSPVIRENVWDWYTSVVKTRLHNDSQELIVFTRWHQEDLIGLLEQKDSVVELNSLADIENNPPNTWLKLNYQAVKTDEPTELDDRIPNEPLYKEKHSYNKLNDTKNLDLEKFECLYQGNPISQAGLLYNDFNTYNTLPEHKERKNYTDTADTGDDYLASICYVIGLDDNIYITDMVYTQEAMELTEDWVASMLDRNDIREADVESNNGGRGFARAIDKLTKPSVRINWFHQSENKEARIISNKSEVNRRIFFPADWYSRWNDAYTHISQYKKNFKANKQDDIADVLTGIIEINQYEPFYFK